MRARVAIILSFGASGALADTPKMGGEMNHVLVTVYQKQVYVAIERPEEMPLTLYNYGEHYDGAASVLDRSGYNSQYGWLAGGFISLPADAAVWVEPIDATPGLRSYSQGAFAPIFGTAGSPGLWEWDGTMVHNWYGASVLGGYEAHYRVFVGTQDRQFYPGYTPGEITLSWEYLSGGLQEGGPFGGVAPDRVSRIPAPGALWLVAFAGLLPRRPGR
jgi:hypothetical protein